MNVINVARDFSAFPGGRYPADGEFSGEEFRDNFILPALSSGGSIIVELDGTRGYGSSFLEEVFGGLVRKGFSPAQVLSKVKLVTSRSSLADEIYEYINGSTVA